MPPAGQFCDVGVAGLCSAGRELAMRLSVRGLRVSLWDAQAGSAEGFVTSQVIDQVSGQVIAHAGTRGGLVGYADRQDFVESLRTPRRIVLFEAPTGVLATELRALLREPDRLLECPVAADTVPSADLELIEMTLLFQLA